MNKEINTFNKLIVIVAAEDTEKQQGIIRGIEDIDIDNKISIIHATNTLDETTLLLADVLKAIVIHTDSIDVSSVDTSKIKLYNIGALPDKARIFIMEQIDEHIVDKLLEL